MKAMNNNSEMTPRAGSQQAGILAYLEAGNSITPLEALRRFGCLRLAAQIFAIKEKGHDVETTMVTDGDKRYASYRLLPTPKENKQLNLFSE